MIKEGDNIIFALLVKNDEHIHEPQFSSTPMSREYQNNYMMEMELILIKEEHFNMFEPYKPKVYQNDKIPVIKLK